MRILLDECLPRQLGGHLTGHQVRTVRQAGWDGIKNGALLQLAAGEYDGFLTIDQRLEREPVLPENLAIITLETSSNAIESLLPLVPAILEALDAVRPGERLRIRGR